MDNIQNEIVKVLSQLEQLTQEERYHNALLNEFRRELERIDQRTRIVENSIRSNKKRKIREYDIDVYDSNIRWFVDEKDNDNVTEYIKAGFKGPSPDYDTTQGIISLLKNKKGTFFDLGANIGAFSLPLASLGWKGIAFEASVHNSEILAKSIKANKFPIKLVSKAVHNQSGIIGFKQEGPQGFVENSVEDNTCYEQIECIRIDDYLSEYSEFLEGKLNFIKIDIEGSEYNALSGMEELFERFNYPTLYVEFNTWNLFSFGRTVKELFELIMQKGYIPYVIYKKALLEYSSDFFPEFSCEDFVFIHNSNGFLSEYIRGAIQRDKANEKIYIVNELRNFVNWLNDYGTDPDEVRGHIPIVYNLKDYPNYLEDEDIVSLLKTIYESLIKFNNTIWDKLIIDLKNIILRC